MYVKDYADTRRVLVLDWTTALKIEPRFVGSVLTSSTPIEHVVDR